MFRCGSVGRFTVTINPKTKRGKNNKQKPNIFPVILFFFHLFLPRVCEKKNYWYSEYKCFCLYYFFKQKTNIKMAFNLKSISITFSNSYWSQKKPRNNWRIRLMLKKSKNSLPEEKFSHFVAVCKVESGRGSQVKSSNGLLGYYYYFCCCCYCLLNKIYVYNDIY